MQHKSHSPKAHQNFLHPPVNFSILPPNISLNTTNLILLKPITIISTLLLTSPSHSQYLPQHHKSHSPKAHYNSLHPPVNFSILPPQYSPQHHILKFQSTIKPIITFKNYT